MSDDDPKQEGSLELLGELIGDLPVPDGIPLPGPVKRRLWRVLGTLVTGLADVPSRILITLPQPIKQQLDSLRQEGFTTSGFIRAALEREFKQRGLKLKKGR